MKAFVAPMHELGEFEEIRERLAKDKGMLQVTGCIDAQKPHFIYCAGEQFPYRLIVTYSDLRAKELYEKELEKIEFQKGNGVKVIKNLDGKIYTENAHFKEILAKHIISPVRFDKAIEYMKNEKIERFIEIGPGKTLTGFIKKDYPEAELHNINNLESLEALIGG